jgi:hypothetical protein
VDIEEGPIWAVLREKAPDRAPIVKSLAAEAAGKLKLVRDTFPTYTLHDEVHAANVLRLMGELLGPRVTDLTGLEAAMLVLAAYHHDIGMVYPPDELDRVKDDPDFTEYLAGRPEEYLAVRHNGGRPPLSVLENYCRSRHAERVYAHLNKLPKDRLKWGAAPLRDALGTLCRSHNLPANDLKEDEFDPLFLADCDLRLCAVLLRLADILDFDGSRTPRSIYDHLGLATRVDQRTAASDVEWRKHLAADGFTFPATREAGYPLYLVAGPDSPAVEHDIRRFLDVVDDEVRRCRAVLETCQPRWRSLTLPGDVDRRNIISDGYKYGDFRFELDRSAVLELFTGERLYEDPYVFVRELLQNAIDAVRLRQVLHPGDPGGVAVSCWEDRDGFVWFRIDDDGVGMDEERLREYFLRVGRSYYRTAELRADLLRRGHGEHEFVAISRFGIGVLSCFLAGDRVELSTRRRAPDGTLQKPLRLSLDRQEEFFVLREPPMAAGPMPVPVGDEVRYRDAPGTGIAVRIDPTKVDITAAELEARVDRYVLCPPVPVTYNGRPVGVESAERVARPSLAGPLSAAVRHRADSQFHLPFRGDLELGALPLDLTAASPTPKLRGQLVVLGARVTATPGTVEYTDLLTGWPEEERRAFPDRLRDALRTAVADQQVVIDTNPAWSVIVRRTGVSVELLRAIADTAPTGGLAARLIREVRGGGHEIQSEFGLISSRGVPLDDDLLRRVVSAASKPQWSHNGIALPGSGEFDRTWQNRGAVVPLGIVALADGLRPDVTMARDRTSAASIPIHSALRLAVRRAARPYVGGPFDWLARAAMSAALLNLPPAEPAVLGTVLRDPLLSGGGWDEEAVIETAGGPRSLAEVRTGHGLSLAGFTGWRQSRWWLPMGEHLPERFEKIAGATAVQIGLDVGWRPRSGGAEAGYFVRSNRLPVPSPGLERFPPLFFVPYDAPAQLLREFTGPANRDNPLAAWLIERADALAADLPVLFRQVGRALTGTPIARDALQSFNTLLDRVAIARPDLRPPPEAYLWKSSGGEWWTR